MLKKSGSNWVKVHSCHHIVEGGDNYDEAKTVKCKYATNSGTNDFRVGGSHKASAWNWFGGVDTIVDFHTSSNGYNADTLRLEICEVAC